MNNKSTKKEPVVQGRWFYAALYSCLGIMLVLAGAVSYNTYNAVKLEKASQAELASPGALQAANASTVQSYLTPQDRVQSQVMPTTPVTKATPAPQATAKPQSGQSISAQPAAAVTPEEAASSAPAAAAPAAPAASAAPAQPKPATTSELSKPIFEEFADGGTMRWPVLGEIALGYSVDRVIYDRTLDQYRTNDSLCITSEIGSPVYAAAGGVVREIENTREMGNIVVIDHGNGWETTYGQLQDGVLVKEGDVVNEGQVIGGVGSPSIYGALLGSHLEFEVALNNEPVNPNEILQ